MPDELKTCIESNDVTAGHWIFAYCNGISRYAHVYSSTWAYEAIRIATWTADSLIYYFTNIDGSPLRSRLQIGNTEINLAIDQAFVEDGYDTILDNSYNGSNPTAMIFDGSTKLDLSALKCVLVNEINENEKANEIALELQLEFENINVNVNIDCNEQNLYYHGMVLELKHNSTIKTNSIHLVNVSIYEHSQSVELNAGAYSIMKVDDDTVFDGILQCQIIFLQCKFIRDIHYTISTTSTFIRCDNDRQKGGGTMEFGDDIDTISVLVEFAVFNDPSCVVLFLFL